MIRHSEGYVAFLPNREGNKKVDECMYNSSVIRPSFATLFFYKFCKFFCYAPCLSTNGILQSKLMFVCQDYFKGTVKLMWLIFIIKIAWTAGMIWKSFQIINGPQIKSSSLMRERNSKFCWPVVGFIFLQEKWLYLHLLFKLLFIINFKRFWKWLYMFWGHYILRRCRVT